MKQNPVYTMRDVCGSYDENNSLFGKKILVLMSVKTGQEFRTVLESTAYSDFLVEDFKCVDTASDSCGWTCTEAIFIFLKSFCSQW